MTLGDMIGSLVSKFKGPSKVHTVKGHAVLVKKNVLDFTDFNAAIIDRVHEALGRRVVLQLVSATVGDPHKGNRGVLSKPAVLENWITTLSSVTPGDTSYEVSFEWEESKGVPGAFLIENNHGFEFYLKTLTLEDVPGKGRVHFVCNSWVYPSSTYGYKRVFFANDTYLPSATPAPLRPFREEELFHLRGDHVDRELKEGERIYGYAVYNDLGDPDKGANYERPVLGGSKQYPYPRRGRTSRPPTKTDPNSESRMFLANIRLDIYVPRDEKFGHLKMSDFLGYAIKSVNQSIFPALGAVVDETPMEFDTFQDILDFYEGGVEATNLSVLKDMIPLEMIKELVRSDGEQILKFPLPQVLQSDKDAWRTDEEFGRETVAGVNPVIISRLQEFPPTSKLDPNTYGDHKSTITASHIENHLDGLTVDEALCSNKLFILEHHDALIPYLNRINALDCKIYASRTIIFLKADGTLRPVAIELSVPHPDGEQHGAVSEVYTPAEHGVMANVWQLAKAYAAVGNSGVHQLSATVRCRRVNNLPVVGHRLYTHAVMEPVVIASNRQLSVVHPIYKLLHPHFRDTMTINALGRQILISAEGGMEKTVFPGRYAMELSSSVYKSWKLTDHALPVDLLKRGVAVEDRSQPHNLRLLIEDYPFAVDGLAIWSAIEEWVNEYCAIYYPTDDVVRSDIELQAWWKEVREVGHGDLRDESWWPTMQTRAELAQTCTTLIWVSSALHAAVNFGQYAYAGYMACRPTKSRRFMPTPGTKEYEEIRTNPEKAFLRTITSQIQTIAGVALIEILSRHASDEIYLGQRSDAEYWTSDKAALEAFQRFGKKLVAIERKIEELNSDERLRNRNGPVKVPYTLLYPNTSDTSGTGGLTGRGVPNSISI
ncbi:hypothetical protein Taro_027298 [Colocasia esculenta]|uniref:Lipoxygenase n=1 Tax=Colocasia esculenta TaxID=4460 RepID=A0A843VM42_COLES|nr:hypothetical protein [Colocasia esculenta]